jgi:hypothetical protein
MRNTVECEPTQRLALAGFLAMAAIATCAVAYGSHAGGLTARFVAGVAGVAVFQIFEPVFNTSR